MEKEDWESWCKKNEEMWEKTDQWIKEYQNDPYEKLSERTRKDKLEYERRS